MIAAQPPATGPVLRIAFVCGAIPDGGTTTFLLNLGSELARRGMAVAVFSAEKDNPHEADFRRLGIRTIVQDHHRHIYEDRILATLMALREFDPQIVIASHSTEPFEILRYLPAGLRKIGMVHIDHPTIYQFLVHYAGDVDAMVCVSRHISANLKAQPAFAALPVHCINLGVPMPASAAPRALTTEPVRLLYLGRLERAQKRVHLFPAILKDLATAGIPLRWTIAGDGPEAGYLRETLVASGKNQTVSLAGKVPYSKVPELLQQHDVFLLASVGEGLPLSLVEAMGAGLVPVVSDLESGIPEVVDERTGILVPMDDIPGYAKAIVYLHEHRECLHSMSTAAQAKVRERFSIPVMADRWMPLLSAPVMEHLTWPERWAIQAPLRCSGSFRFSRLGRVLRRFKKRLRG
jgi:glycosyltransferase involved in cell wall biosynthesis